MKKLGWLFSLGLFATSCFAFVGTIEKGHYTSKRGELTVEVPKVKKLSIMDGGKSCEHCLQHVDFVPDGYYWMMDKAYLLEWFKVDKKPDENIIMILPKQMQNEFSTNNGKLAKPVCQFIQLEKGSAYQCKAQGVKDKVAAGYIGTSMMRKGYLINAYLLYPEASKPSLESYNQWLNSIEVR